MTIFILNQTPGPGMAAGLHVRMLSCVSFTLLSFHSDYRGLKERINAIKEEIAAQKLAHDGKSGPNDVKKASALHTRTPTGTTGGSHYRAQINSQGKIPSVLINGHPYAGAPRAVIAGMSSAAATATAPALPTGRTPSDISGVLGRNAVMLKANVTTTSGQTSTLVDGKEKSITGVEVMLPTLPKPIGDWRKSEQFRKGDDGLSKTAVGFSSGFDQVCLVFSGVMV